MRFRVLQTSMVILGVILLVAGFQVMAQPGTLIQNTDLPVDGRGVSVAADCEGNLYYTIRDPATNSGFPNLYVMDKDGNLLNTVPVVDPSGAALEIDEMAWDEGRELLWGLLHDTSPIDVYLIDPVSGLATFQFTSQTTSIGTFRDGLAYDPSDDTLWISGDLSLDIEHYKTDGTLINFITPKDGAGANLNNISGVVVGVGDLLYLGQAFKVEIVKVKKSDGSFIGNFASPGGARDEGLECDPVNFAPTLALWSRDAGPPEVTPSFVSAIEIETGTCQCCSLEALCVPTVNPDGRNIPTAPGKGGQGQNQDGYYELGTNGCAGPEAQIFVRDTGTGTVWGPFDPGTKIKYTEANGKPPGIKPHAANNGNGGGARAVDWHIWGQGDAEVFAVDLGGNPTDPVPCLVPPPPK